MPKSNELKKVLVIGSGPIQIGQAAEFDFSGSQACRALREEGIRVVLVNSNPATIMTDFEMADVIYIEPLVADVVARIIEKERPDGIVAGLGGQTALNLTTELAEAGILTSYNVRVLGTPLEAIYNLVSPSLSALPIRSAARAAVSRGPQRSCEPSSPMGCRSRGSIRCWWKRASSAGRRSSTK
jgi:hypothetical protein